MFKRPFDGSLGPVLAAIAGLAVAAAVCAALVGYDVSRHGDDRAAIRSRRSALRPGDLALSPTSERKPRTTVHHAGGVNISSNTRRRTAPDEAGEASSESSPEGDKLGNAVLEGARAILGIAAKRRPPSAALVADWFSDEDSVYDDLPETTAS
jgi:hypothetical protein